MIKRWLIWLRTRISTHAKLEDGRRLPKQSEIVSRLANSCIGSRPFPQNFAEHLRDMPLAGCLAAVDTRAELDGAIDGVNGVREVMA